MTKLTYIIHHSNILGDIESRPQRFAHSHFYDADYDSLIAKGNKMGFLLLNLANCKRNGFDILSKENNELVGHIERTNKVAI